jgi:hypothetical protein
MSNKRKMLSGGIVNRTTATSELELEKKNPSLYEPEPDKPKLEAHEQDEMMVEFTAVDNARELQAKTMLLEQELAEAEQKLEEAEQEIDAVKQQTTAIIENAIIPKGEGKVQLKRLVLTTTGIENIPDDFTEQEWVETINTLGDMNKAVQWAIGDLVLHADLVWKHTYEQMAKATKYTVKSLREFAYVARNVSIRMDKLSFGHHHLVASISDENEQEKWLQQAIANDWSVAEFREALTETKTTQAKRKYQPRVYLHMLFAKDKIPKVDTKMETDWLKAKNGDEEAKKRLLDRIQAHRIWLENVISELEE